MRNFALLRRGLLSTARPTSLAAGSIAVGLTVFLLKFAAWKATGSSALLADALETWVNILSALGTLAVLKISSLPADHNHPYGHEKAEDLCAFTEALLVTGTALLIWFIAWKSYRHPHFLTAPFRGLSLNALGGALNLAWGVFLLKRGKKLPSAALTSSGRHLLSDCWANLGLLLGMLVIPFLGWEWMDPLLSFLVGLCVLWNGSAMLRQATATLMDHAPPSELVSRAQAIIARQAWSFHDLRMRQAGRKVFIEGHLVVPDHMAVAAAHDICDRIEQALLRQIGTALIHIHVEPESQARREGTLTAEKNGGIPLAGTAPLDPAAK